MSAHVLSSYVHVCVWEKASVDSSERLICTAVP